MVLVPALEQEPSVERGLGLTSSNQVRLAPRRSQESLALACGSAGVQGPLPGTPPGRAAGSSRGADSEPPLSGSLCKSWLAQDAGRGGACRWPLSDALLDWERCKGGSWWTKEGVLARVGLRPAPASCL